MLYTPSFFTDLASGGSYDWVFGKVGVPYAFTPELRDTETFILTPSAILPSGREIWAGIRAIMIDIASH